MKLKGGLVPSIARGYPGSPLVSLSLAVITPNPRIDRDVYILCWSLVVGHCRISNSHQHKV